MRESIACINLIVTDAHTIVFSSEKIIGVKTYLFENFSQEKAPENSRWPFLGSKSVKNG